MSDDAEHPIATIGHNNPPLAKMISLDENFAKTVQDFLADEHKAMAPFVADVERQMAEIPEKIEDEDTLGKAAKLVKLARDGARRIEALRVKEKDPYFRAAQAVDNFFISLRDRLARSDRKQKPGLADLLQQAIDDYQQRKLETEMRRRREEAARAEREAAERRRLEQEAARKAEEDRLAAERARKPEHIETKSEAAAQSAESHATAAVEAQIAERKAEETYVETLAKPADMVRTRVEEGPTVTMAQEKYAEIDDEALLDKEKLWPFISLDAKEKALRAWAKTTGHTQQMPGAKIGSRNKSVVR